MNGEELVPIARAALAEITDPADVGALVAVDQPAEGVVDLRFAALMPGYPGWLWTVSVTAFDDAESTVLELELLPGDDALLAPAWVPWAERLAEWRRSHTDDAADEGDEDDPADGSDDDFDEDDESEPDASDEDDPFDNELDEDALDDEDDLLDDDGVELETGHDDDAEEHLREP